MIEDKRTAIAVLLCIVIVMVYSEMFLAPMNRAAVKHSTAASAVTAAPVPGLAAPRVPGNPTQGASSIGSSGIQAAAAAVVSNRIPALAEIEASPHTVIQSELIEISIAHLGGRLNAVKLRNYRAHRNEPALVDLVVARDGYPLPLGAYSGENHDAAVMYTVANGASVGATVTIPATGDVVLPLVGTLANGQTIRKTFRFDTRSYLFSVDVAVEGASEPTWLEWAEFIAPDDHRIQADMPHFMALGMNEKLTSVPSQSAPTQLTQQTDSVWAALSTRYFMAAMLPSAATTANAAFGKVGDLHLVRVRGDVASSQFGVFVGPKDPQLLETYNLKLERSIDLGWFTFLAAPLLVLIRVFYSFLGNYGLAIILLTLLIKGLFLPLTKASFESMKKMQDLQPEMKELRDRIKDPTELNRQMMDLYKRKGVNPLGGCFPVMIQIPVFIGLYNALLNSFELRHAPFALWINDLSAPEHLDVFGIGIPVMVLLMGASMLIQQWTTPTTMDPIQKKTMLMVPVIFTISFVIFPFPAGLVLYWLVNNFISIVQQMYLRSDRRVTPLQATALASVAIFTGGFLLTLI